MNDANKPIRFGERLHELLEKSGMSQARLAERAGVERSTISRLIKGDRAPTPETLKCLAPALQVDVGTLVEGTDAADKLTEGASTVRRQDYDAVVKKMLDYEERVKDLELRLHASSEAVSQWQMERSRASTQLSEVQFKLENTERDLQMERQRSTDLNYEVRRYRTALQRAVADVSSLRGQLEEIAAELKGSVKSSRTATILAGVAALAGVVTVATYLANEDAKKHKGPEGAR